MVFPPGRKSEAAAQRQVVGLQVLQGPGVPGRPGRPEAGWLQRLAAQLLAAVISCRRACADRTRLNVETIAGRAAQLGRSRKLEAASIDGWMSGGWLPDGWMLQLRSRFGKYLVNAPNRATPRPPASC